MREQPDPGVAGAEKILAESLVAYRIALGNRLVAAYALGSLAHGGFSELVSDIDLGLIVRDPPSPDKDSLIRAITDRERRKGSTLHSRLSVFWGTPATLRGDQEGGRFPSLDRLDLIENGRLLAGTDEARAGLPRPSLSELTVTGAEFALDYLAGIRRARGGAQSLTSLPAAKEDAIEEILSPELLVTHGVRRLTKVVLFPVRFLYTAATGRIGTNHAATDHYLNDDSAPSRALVAAALAWRTSKPTDETAAVTLLREQMVPLYLHFIDDHIRRLDSLSEPELVEGFRGWRHRLSR